MSELVLGVSCNKLVPVCSKVCLLTVDENTMHAQLGLKHIFCVSTVADGVRDLEITVTALHQGQNYVIELKPVLILNVRLNPRVLPSTIGVVVHKWRES